MTRNRICNSFLLAMILLIAGCGQAPKSRNKSKAGGGSRQFSPGQPPAGYEHDRWVTLPRDQVRHFTAFTVSFDGRDDDDGDGTSDLRGQPEWVAYQINSLSSALGRGPKRPTWFTDDKLHSQGIAPDDSTYHLSGYSRGHMCMKYIAWRLGQQADYETHTMLNACPQRQKFNAGIWLSMENMTQAWADRYGRIWVVCGPVFSAKSPELIGDPGEMKIPVPDAFYKIVIMEEADTEIDALAFMYPHKDIQKVGGRYRHHDYLTSVDEVERLTGLDFMSALDDNIENDVEAQVPVIWE